MAILTADSLVFKITLATKSITATLLHELEDDLDPILFINKMNYRAKMVLFFTTMLGTLFAFDLDAKSIIT